MLLDSNKNKKLIEFDDIIKELAEEKNIPYEEIEELCSLSLKYIKHLTEQERTLSVLIPELGNLYYSERFGEFFKNRFNKYDTGLNQEAKKEMYTFLQTRSNIINYYEDQNEVRKSYHRRKPFLYKFKNIYKKLFDGKIVRLGATLGYKELWTKFSEIQNNIQNNKEYK